jgi:serine/threonine protein kinase
MNHDLRLLFHELSDLSPSERERVFCERRISSELRAEVESLLSFDSTTNRSLTDRVSNAAENVLDSSNGLDAGRCGPYRLVRLLGSGGMGAVYLAERTDGEIQHDVAVKLLRADGNRPAWRDRFLNERQLLASLHHPSIVHVIDAGHTDDGRPYLVMEYVEGVPIDVYAADIELSERLRLFMRVCDGVSHAHQHLIIHRDLKPSNILVDDSGQPKLLDFGIAKLLDEAGETTQTIERMLTPNYASPEQVKGANQTTATDVYSLGAVLYKLLTGRAPREPDMLAPSRVNPDIPTDLDYVLRKALRDEPEERYTSVEAFAGDIQALLESRPVQARSGNAWYRTRKFLRRHWVPVVAVTMVIASLSAGLFIANRERRVAEQRFGQLRQLSNKVFELDKAIRNLPGSTQARQNLVSASLGYLEGLASSARGNLDLTQEVADGYARVGRIQGVPVELNLGETAKAETSLKNADALIETVLAARPNDRHAMFRSAVIAHDRMIVAQEEHRNPDAVAYAHKAAARTDAFLNLGNTPELERGDAAGIYGNIALACVNMHLYADGASYARRTVELARSMPSGGERMGSGLSVLANALRYQGDLEGALNAIQEARKLADQTVHSNETLRMIHMYGVLLREGLILGEDGGINLGRADDAMVPLQEALDITENAARKDPNDATSRSRVGNSGTALGNILRHKDPQRALAVYDLAIRRLGETPNKVTARRDKASALANSSYALRALYRIVDAKQRIDVALQILQETKDYPTERVKLDSEIFIALCAQADHEAEAGDVRTAAGMYKQLLQKVMAAKPEPLADLRDAPRIASLYEALARLDLTIGKNIEAESMNARRLELWRSWDRKLPNNVFVSRQLEVANLH